MEAVLADLGEYGPFKIFRPYNDARFAKGRSPYKEQIGAVGETEGGSMDELRTAPRGYAKDHPWIDILRRKGLIATVAWGPESWLHTKAVVTKIGDVWKGEAVMNDWLDTHVGPSQMRPPDWGR